MNIIKTVLTLGLLAICTAVANAAATDPVKKPSRPDEATISSYRKAIREAKDNHGKAIQHKTLGDYFASREDYKNAAAEYMEALKFSRDFTNRDRYRMAIAISWGDRLKESIIETRLLLETAPDYTEARVHLARCLSWDGKLAEALLEAEKVLKTQPDNRDALLVKANVLSWQDKQQAAIPIYRSLLAKEENFDARLGLANSLLATGKFKEAQEASKQLRPAYPYQENALNNFRKAYKKATAQEVDLNYSYYEDTDGNIVHRYGAGYSFWLANFKLSLGYRHTEAHDRTYSNSAEEAWLRAYTNLNRIVGVGAGIGVTMTGDDRDRTFLNGQLTADFNIPIGTVSLLLGQDTFIDTAGLVRNNIRYLTVALNASQRITDRLMLYESYAFRDFSDNNNSHNFQISPVYTLYRGTPLIKTGYRFRYLNFDRQSGSGYFDPNDFTSHQIFINASLDKGAWYGYIEPYGGYQSFRRNNANTDDMFGGITGTAGYRFTDYLRGEVNGEFGNYAVQSSSGFEYFQIGARLIFTF